MRERLAENEVGARKYFYPLTSEYSCYENKYDTKKTPVADWVSKRVLTLPLYADLDISTVDVICDLILQCGKSAV